MLRFDREQQNSVKQLSFNKKINKLKKIDLSTTITAIHLFKSIIISYPDYCIKLLTGPSWFLSCLFTP